MLGGPVRRLAPIAVLYGGRVGVAGLGLVVLPWLSRSMPTEQFGLAATILALQTLAVIVDLGLSINIAREFPVLPDAMVRRYILERSERTLVQLYCALAALVAGASAAGLVPVSIPTALLTCVSLLLIVWQNLIVTGFVARQQFVSSTLLQFTSLLFRHGCSLVLVTAFAGTVQVFVVGQVAGAAAVLALSRWIFMKRHRAEHRIQPVSARSIGTTSIAVMIYTMAGACTMQLDKVLLTALASPVSTGSYFLASTLSLVPITFLASPASQYVQPRLIAALDLRDEQSARRWIIRLAAAILVLAVLPGICLGVAAPFLVPLWLQGAPQEATVIRYVALLVPGASIGALGLVPVIVLIARRDYAAMAIISSLLAVLVLSATAFLATHGTIAAVCITYALYHVVAAGALWWRAWRIEPWLAPRFAIRRDIANGGMAEPTRLQTPQP